MAMKVDETRMLHFDKITLTQKTKFDNFFGVIFLPIPVGLNIVDNCISSSRVFPFFT